MKKFIPVVIILFFKCQILYNQTFNSISHPITEIFTDFHLNLNDTSKTTGFGLGRAYFGYNFVADSHFSGTIIVNAGKPDDLAPGSVSRIYAVFREASITYTDGSFKLSFGITGTHLFDFQQKFWGKRYVANTYQSINGYGFVADLGIAMDYQINDIIKTDVTVMNGEGYSNIQLDNSIRTAAGITITPNPHFAFRVYGDVTRDDNLWQPMFVGFAGFRNEMVTIGAEITYKSNLDLIEKHHAWGVSGTGAVRVAEKTELFARYDYSTSVIVPQETQKWNYLNDGSFLIMGIQYAFNENVKIALDYQGNNPYDNDLVRSDVVFVNALFKFGR